MMLNGNEIQVSEICFSDLDEVSASIKGTGIDGNDIEIKFTQSDCKTLKCLEEMLFPEPPVED